MEEQASKARPSAAFPFQSKYVTVQGYKIHYVEEGEGEPILFIHGNPTSSYIWRNIFPAVAGETKKRAIALDLLGFGRSDKPPVDYSVQLHYRIVEGFIDQLKLKNLVLVLHDWGGPLGGSYSVRHPDQVRAVALMETLWWAPDWKEFSKRFRWIFKLLRSPLGYVMIQVLNMFVKRLLPEAVMNKDNITKEVMLRYREPFPTVKSRRAIRVFPKLIPIGGKPREAYEFMKEIEAGLSSMKCPVLLIQAVPGTVTSSGRVPWLKEKLPQLAVKQFGRGFHFIQEDAPDKISRLLVEWIREKEL